MVSPSSVGAVSGGVAVPAADGMMGRVSPIDLGRPRDLGDLLGLSLGLWFRHLPLFFALAFVVVAPVVLLVDGVWAGTLDDVEAADAPVAAGLVSTLLQLTVVPALVTAMHVIAVQDIARGESPSFGRALRSAFAVLVPVGLVVVLYALAVGLGFLALIVPGLWLSVRWYFGAQAAVVDDSRGVGALRRSGELVAGTWWRVAGILFVLGLLGMIVSGVLAALVGVVVGVVGDADAGIAVGNVLLQTLAVSWTAVAGTLLYFDLRARKAPAFPGAEAPERPWVGPSRA